MADVPEIPYRIIKTSTDRAKAQKWSVRRGNTHLAAIQEKADGYYCWKTRTMHLSLEEAAEFALAVVDEKIASWAESVGSYAASSGWSLDDVVTIVTESYNNWAESEDKQ